MKIYKFKGIVILTLFSAIAFWQPAMAQTGAKALFYDPSASGTVQMSNTGSPGGGFSPSVRRGGSGGGSANPVSNYYENLNPGVMYWIELIRTGSGYVRRVSNDRVFRSGDRIRIHVTTNADGYLHTLHKGSSGAGQILPVSNTRHGEVRMGTDYVIPSNGGWLRFDNNPGQEKIKLVFAAVNSSNHVLSVMRNVSTQSASTVSDQLLAVYNQYRHSPHTIQQVHAGSKNLIVVGNEQPQSGYGRPPQGGGYAPPRQDQSGYGSPPQQGGYGLPPRQGGYARGGYGPPPQQGGYGPAPQQGGYAQGGYAPAPNGYGHPGEYAQGGYAQPPIQHHLSQAVFNTQSASTFSVNTAVYNAPGNYVVNTAPGRVKEPVMIEIVLNHHP